MTRSSISLSKKFENALIEEVGDPLLYAPSMKLSVIHKGNVLFRWSCGEDYRYYDLASLTKILFTAPLWMGLVQNLNRVVDDEVKIYLPWWEGAGKVKVKHLLTHTAGLEWWKPYYNFIGHGLSHKPAWEKLKGFLTQENPSLQTEKKAIYSDLDLFYLGFIAEELLQKDLFSLWEEVSDRMSYKTLHFQKENRPRYKKSLYAPTGFSAWREKSLVGEVHDDNAAALGGVAPHAGLFGTLNDVEDYLLGLRDILDGKRRFGFQSQDLLPFISRQTPPERGDFGYIFWKPTSGASSSGSGFDDSSFGHLGFTGTSLWYSLKNDLGVILLSNRVHYGSDVEFFKNLRPLIHDLIVKQVL